MIHVFTKKKFFDLKLSLIPHKILKAYNANAHTYLYYYKDQNDCVHYIANSCIPFSSGTAYIFGDDCTLNDLKSNHLTYVAQLIEFHINTRVHFGNIYLGNTKIAEGNYK